MWLYDFALTLSVTDILFEYFNKRRLVMHQVNSIFNRPPPSPLVDNWKNSTSYVYQHHYFNCYQLYYFFCRCQFVTKHFCWTNLNQNCYLRLSKCSFANGTYRRRSVLILWKSTPWMNGSQNLQFRDWIKFYYDLGSISPTHMRSGFIHVASEFGQVVSNVSF